MTTPTSTLPQNQNEAKSPILTPTPANFTRLAQLLTDGQLLLLPTETVYGIAVNLLSPQARARATQLKAGVTPNWVIHVAQPEDIFSWAPSLSPLARRLVQKSLPGPVAFQIKLTPDELTNARTRLGEAASEALLPDTQHSVLSPQHFSLTFRCPESPSAQQLLASVNAPIAIIGAGTPTHPALFDLTDLPEGLLNPPQNSSDPPPIAAALDAGPTRYRKSSTLVKIDQNSFKILREGVIDERILQKFADLNVLFLCTGNTCRSPMASAIATKILSDRLHLPPSELPLRHIVIQSAGLHANRGSRATPEAAQAVKSLGADLTTHQSQPATPDLLRRADFIYTMTAAHRDEVLHLYPAAARKTERLDPKRDIEDPIGSDYSVYQEVAEHLAQLLKRRLSELRI